MKVHLELESKHGVQVVQCRLSAADLGDGDANSALLHYLLNSLLQYFSSLLQ